MQTDLVTLVGKYNADTVKELHHRVIERLGMLYEDKPVNAQQLKIVTLEVENEFNSAK